MHKKLIVIIAVIVGVLIIAAGVVGAITVLNKQHDAQKAEETAKNWDADPTKQEAQTTPDLSVDLGACTVVSAETIANSLKPPVTEVRDAENRGFGYEMNGDRSQSCVFAFSAADNLMNRFTLTVTEFKDDTNKKNAVTELANYTMVSGIGEKAGYQAASDENLKQDSYILIFIKDMKQYTLGILQPSEGDVFAKDTAQTALEKIAKSIK